MKKQKKELIRIIIAAIILIAIVIIELVVNKHFDNNNTIKYIFMACYLICYLFLSYKILFKAFRNLFHGQFLDENFLMAIASIGAFVIGEYVESIVVMLFYQIGELFQSYAVKKSRKDIAGLMDIKPDIAWKIVDNEEIAVDPLEVNINDIILVKVGEKIPLDGIITKGTTQINTASLTGESLPKDVSVGDNVLSGSINMTAVIYVKVTKLYTDSTVSKILELVENATSRKTKVENFITRFAKIYTPVVVIAAIILAFVVPIFDHNFFKWFYRGLSFLVISCPCALVISVPLSFFAGVGAASKQGILVKGTNYLELLSKTNIFIFDKTGTITKGNFEVSEIHHEIALDEFIQISMIAEAKTNHPIAKSIMNYCANQGYQLLNQADDYQIKELPGLGIVGENGENLIIAGNEKLLEQYHISYQKCDKVGTVIYLAKNQTFAGYFLIKDQIKDESKEVITKLNNANYQTIMLTGDQDAVANEVVKEVGISKYYAGLLPNEKVDKLEEILKQKKPNDVVAYLGDGINDAPALMIADVGIAMGGLGSDSTIEASDVVLMFDKLSSIIDAKKIAKKTMRIVKENIIFAISVKIIVLILSALGITNIWLAIFADVGVAILAILNAMRAMYIKKKSS